MSALPAPYHPTLVETTRRIVQTAHPRRIILFGSAARGSLTPDSDLDLLVIVRGPVHRRKLAQAIYRNLHGLDLPVDIVVVTEADVASQSNRPYSIIKPALDEGQVVYDAER